MPESAPDLDLRLVRYFVAVADHRHFGRAAEALHVTQPALSRQVRRLEQQLGTPLLDRTPQGSVPTPAGEAFLTRARALLGAAAEATAYTRAAATPSTVTVGYTTGLFVTDAVRELRRRHPDAVVRALHLGWDQTRDGLLDHRVDAVVTRLPLRDDGLDVRVLFEEPRALMVPRTHRLAGRLSVTLDDIADEPMPRVHDDDWNAFWRIDPRPDGRPAPGGPLIEALEDKLELIASGEAVAVVAGGPGIDRLRPDLVVVPLEGVAPSRVVVASRADETHPLVRDFREVAHRLRPGNLLETVGERRAG